MDPLTAIGLASNIVSFIDFGAKVLSTAREIYNSTSGDTSSNRNYESVAHQLEKFAVDLLTADTFSGKEKALCALAQECRDLAIQIQDLLQKSRPKDPKSKRQVAWSTLKSLKYKEERLELQERLGNCRDQLALQLNEKYCSEIRRSLDALVSRSQDDSLRVVRLQQQVEELRRILEKTHSRDSQNYIQQLLQLSEDSFHALVSQRLIERLAFDDMYGRFDTIAKAHYDTFKWIFYGDTNSDGSTDNADDIARSVMEYSYDERQDAYRDSARESFLSWLSSDHGIFHICGKLGSGKSTLMKFLCEDTHTKKVLEQWAGDRTLVMASFFFWKPGSKLQKSMDGLLRALLYETLKSLPALVPTILPEQWNAISSTPWQMHTKLELRPETIREAFGRLIDSHTEDLAICFFIDGLDEYEQTRQEDHLSMIERLDSWCGGTAKNIKICVSSREYNVFMNRLPSQRRIRMQNLTDKDIRLYIQDKIDFAESPEQAQYLVETIASKADGIFLWVALVVTRARELHENSVDFEGIMDEVDRVPRGLEELFKHILESLEPYERKRAYQTFAMMRRLQREDIHFPLLAYAFIDNYEKHSQAVDAPLPASSREPKSVNDLRTQAIRKLRGYCKGLVENATTEPARPDIWKWEILQFCHRSVPEFLDSNMLGDRAQYMPPFKEEDAISRLLLACIRMHPSNGSNDRRWLARLSYIMLKLRHDVNLVNEPFVFEEQLESAFLRQGMGMPGEAYSSVVIVRHNSVTRLMTFCFGKSREESPYLLGIPCLISCYLGHPAYLRWKLDRSPAITDAPVKMGLIFLIVYKSQTLPDSERRMIFESLSDRGFSPHTITPTGESSDLTSPELTVWEQFVTHLFIRSLDDKADCTRRLKDRGFSRTRGSTAREVASTFLELFLEAGADPYIAFTTSGQLHVSYLTLLRGKEKFRQLGISIHKLKISTSLLSPDRYPDPDGDGILVTLIDLIDIMGFENSERLIVLVRRNMRIQGDGLEKNDSCILPDTAFWAQGMYRSFLLISLLGILSAVLIVKKLFMSG